MTPVEPSIHVGAELVVFAKDQPHYVQLPAYVGTDGTVMTEWELTEEEREMLFMGGRIRLWVHHAIGQQPCGACGAPMARLLSPVRLEALEPEED